MNRTQAGALLAKLSGRKIAGFELQRTVGVGVSAAVYEAVGEDGIKRAVKVYDPAFANEERLRRELLLVGHDCKHVVGILGGGSEDVDGTKILYLILEFIDGQELTKVRDSATPLADGEIRRLLAEIHVAATFLLEKDLCHRDIKPQNIKLRSNGDLVLLDMGVLRTVGESDVTQEGRNVATRRYSPPELQHRKEQNDKDGFEAITVYQIGAVLYELIQRTRLFAEVPDHPEATLSQVIDRELPRFVGASVGSDLCELALRCLAKDWRSRPRMAELASVATATRPASPSVMRQRLDAARAAFEGLQAVQSAANAHLESLKKMAETGVELAVAAVRVPDIHVPKVEIHPGFKTTTMVVATYQAELQFGFLTPVLLAVFIGTDVKEHLLTCRGFGLYGSAFLPTAEQIPRVFSAGSKSPVYEGLLEDLWRAPLDLETFSKRLSDWAVEMVMAYLQRTEGALAAYISAETASAEARLRGERATVSSRMVDNMVFNRAKVAQLVHMNWKRIG
ncbi:MAG TPA: protein kinase [Polyangiaceae bacterium]|nr:protein kinase [Polyangiaceae bacterium]